MADDLYNYLNYVISEQLNFESYNGDYTKNAFSQIELSIVNISYHYLTTFSIQHETASRYLGAYIA